ncbi:fatty acid desaturase-domain-containing protein [Roridomyces roridus]|uniref:Fatty acid desaturase-domain-containing protein n=1 Tax=Roridomyces roridus TaxID=1738132 RepID=A0AAD7C2J8_9AGAR|nr:fatty acid desaturase-domain-containing protein [Roridomyces roridus]
MDQQQVPVKIPNLSMKDLLSSIPPRCFERSTLRSLSYLYAFLFFLATWRSSVNSGWDLFVIACLWRLAGIADTFTTTLSPTTRVLASFSIWSLYGFFAGLFAMGLWILAHEAGHGAFSKHKSVNNVVGWVLHSSLGVPYHSWRISHAKHHASTGHMTQDQVFVPWTRSQMGLPPLDATRDDLLGAKVSEAVQNEMWEALGDTPFAAFIKCAIYLVFGLPMYLIWNTGGQLRYPKGTNHFNPSAVIFAKHHHSQVVVSDLGIFIWLGLIVLSCYHWSFATVFRVYLVPYIWVNHWLVLITFLQHSDPLLPHYRAEMFTFARGALCTLDRSLLGDLGPMMGWLGAHATHGICETHVLHHLTSKIPHYNAWEATDALRARLSEAGIDLVGRPAGWAEVYRVIRACKFVEDEGGVVFYKNARGIAAARPVFAAPASDVEDSGIEVDK